MQFAPTTKTVSLIDGLLDSHSYSLKKVTNQPIKNTGTMKTRKVERRLVASYWVQVTETIHR